MPLPEMQKAALAGGPNCRSAVLSTPRENTEPREAIQVRRIARLFFLQPATAAVIAELAFAGCER
jgi:hypothetical protein